MQSFWAIIHVVFFLSDWFIAHPNVLKGLNTLYGQVRLHSHFEKPGPRGFCCSAQDCTDVHLQTLLLPFSSAEHTQNFTRVPTISTAETGPHLQQEHGCKHPLSCRVSLDERPERPCANVTLQNNFTPPMQSSLPPTNHKNDGEWKQTNKTENDARIFDGCLLSVLAQFKAIIKFNFKKTK